MAGKGDRGIMIGRERVIKVNSHFKVDLLMLSRTLGG